MSQELVTVATYPKPMEAETAKLRLEAEGLTAFIADGEFVRMDWLLGSAVGDVKVQVPTAQAEAAAAVLAAMRDERDRRAARADGESEVCLSCGAALAEDSTACAACGWTFAGEEAPPAAGDPLLA